MTAQENIIYAQELTKSINNKTIVDGLNLEIPAGVIFGFIGPSGCGKTTSVRLLLGIYTPTSGDVEVLNRKPQKFRRADRAKIGYMPQQFVLYPDLTVWENLNFAASLYGVPLQRNERLKDLLELVELTGHEKKKVRNLSGGMQRRLSLAASIVHDPKLIFMDEPTTGIDPVLRRKFWDYFQQLKADGHTMFVTTQYVNEAAYCDYVGVMANGRLLMVETPEGLRRRAMGGDIIHLQTAQVLTEAQRTELASQPFVTDSKVTRMRGQGIEIVVDDASVALPLLLDWCHEQDIVVESASEHMPLYDDIFVELIRQETAVVEDIND
ncbi:MAG: ABC transporter ATP-binding protein [Anaerolineales bacterium]|nr:ABC transporter ATP-binding protein [Anaerolineales bacterium]